MFLYIFMVYKVRKAREASIVLRIPRRRRNSFLLDSPVISEAITAACPVPRAGRKEHSGATRIEEIEAKLKGGGLAGQAGALRFSIARALIKKDPSLRPVLKDSGMLTRDSRVKERKKPGQPGARKRFQFSKR